MNPGTRAVAYFKVLIGNGRSDIRKFDCTIIKQTPKGYRVKLIDGGREYVRPANMVHAE